MTDEPSRPPHPQLRPSALLTDDRPFDTGRKPVTVLTDDMAEIARTLIYGLDGDEIIEGKEVPAGYPLTLRQAARFAGVRVAKLRFIASSPVFIAEQNRLLTERRKNERARNLHVAVSIRDDEGQNLAADKTVRLKAIQVIEGAEGKASVNVQINNTNASQVSPGYVIKLSPSKPAPETIDATVIEGQADE